LTPRDIKRTHPGDPEAIPAEYSTAVAFRQPIPTADTRISIVLKFPSEPF
jgi:hypothetical protein